jgi:H+/Cl- antiporter ClcA
MKLSDVIGRLGNSAARRRIVLVGLERWRRRALFIVGGIGVGCFAVLLARLADLAQRQFAAWTHLESWLPWILTPVGFATCAYAARRWFRNSQGSGIPQTIVALRESDGEVRAKLVSLRVAAGKLLLTVAGLLCGASTGREGPTVQVGASIMYAAGRFAPRMRGGLIVAGGAAGIAAAFNAPLAGIMFGIEEMSRKFEGHTSALVIAAVIAAGITAMAFLGNYTYFGTASGMIAAHDWLGVIACGLLGGLAGGVFSRLVIGTSRKAWKQRFRLTGDRGAVAFALLCGVGVVACGVLSGDRIYGTGYVEVRAALDGHAALPASFFGLKLIATTLSSISGIPGGIFSPSLAVGAGLGADVASLLGSPNVALIIPLGMVAYLAGVVQAPMTAFIIVTEMTNDHEMLIPLMTAAFLAHWISRLICHEGIYHALARNLQEGLRSTPPQ